MYEASKKCDDLCFRPSGRRLALFGAKDDYECYAESYVKCFWGLCDHHKSVDTFINKTDCRVITEQPARKDVHDLPFRGPGVIQSILVTN